MDGWTERQIFGIITIIIIIAIIMINGVIIDSRPYFSFVNNDFPTDKFKRERDVYISPIFDDKFTDKRRFLRRQEGSVKFSPFFAWFRISKFPRRRGISLPKISTFLRDQGRVFLLSILFPCTFSSVELLTISFERGGTLSLTDDKNNFPLGGSSFQLNAKLSIKFGFSN